MPGKKRHGGGEPGLGTREALHADPDWRNTPSFLPATQTAVGKEPVKGPDQKVFCLAERFQKHWANVSQ